MATVKKPSVKKSQSAAIKPAVKKAKKVVAKKAVSTKVDYYPNRMTFWVSAAAGSLIVLLAVICAYNR